MLVIDDFLKMPPFKLASAGDDVKLWDFQSFDLLKQYNPHDHNISALSWSSDATWLASVSSLDNKIALSCLKNGSAAITTLDCEEGQTCIEYNSNSKYLLSGGTSGAVRIWDVKTRKEKKSFKDHQSTITCACFNRNDTSIASGSETGEIIITNVVSGFSSSPLISPKTQAVRQVRFKKSILGAVYDSGFVSLWDTNTRRLIHMFNIHRAPATGIVFSPINDVLMMTAGLDKRFIVYDVAKKVMLNVVETDDPLTAIDIMYDGSTVVVGSTRGKLTVYDLRKGFTPIAMFAGHKSSVQSLKFQPENNSNQYEKSIDKIKEMNRRQLPQAPVEQLEVEPVKILNVSVSQTNNVAEQSNTSAPGDDIFSPVREGYNHNQSSSIEIRNSDVNHSNVQNLSKSMGYNSSLQNLSQGVFSPIGGNSSLSQQQKMEQVSGQLMNSIDDSIHFQDWHKIPVVDSPISHVREMVKDAMRPCTENMQEELKAMWRTANDQRSSFSSREETSLIKSSVFQTEFLRDIIQEELEEFRAESHRDLQALHVEILKQFQIQQAEISSLVQHFSVNRELVAEIERLREENERLKKYF